MKLKKLLAAVDELGLEDRWTLRQHLAGTARFYGDGGTIHATTELDVETHEGRVVSVWFRCQLLPFGQHRIERDRASEMDRAYLRGEDATSPIGDLVGVEIVDPVEPGSTRTRRA